MKHKKINLLILGVIATTGLFLQSCTTEVVDPPNPNEEELITTVELNFTSTTNSNDARTFSFKDEDGDGGNGPSQFDTIRLDTNDIYSLNVRFLDESGTEVEDITVEITEEANDHLVCYTTTTGTEVTITDEDENMLALGLSALVSTGDTNSGTFKIALKHQPDIKTGDCDLGETDVEVTFELIVE